MSEAVALHRSSIVVDTAAPSACPGAFSDAIVDRLSARERGAGWEMLLTLEELVADALVAGDLPEFVPTWRSAGVDVASVTVGVFGDTPFAYDNVRRDLTRWQRVFDAVPDLVRVDSAADARRAHADGRHGLLLHLADSSAIGSDLGALERLRDLGIRSMQLTYNAENLVGHGCSSSHERGLTAYGRDVVAAMNDLGLLIDLAHAGDRTTLDAIEASRLPVAVTHSVCRSIVDLDRAVSDEVLRAIGASGGYFGVLVTPFTITTDGAPSLDRWLEHVARAVDLVGPGQVGIGTDWGVRFPPFLSELLNAELNRPGFKPSVNVDWAARLPGFDSWADWPSLTRALLAAGYPAEDVSGFLGENFIRVFERVRPS